MSLIVFLKQKTASEVRISYWSSEVCSSDLAFQQMRDSRRRVILLATLREMEATLTDAAIAMFGALMGRAHLRARKRLEQGIAISGREGRDRLMRIATVLETVSRVARTGEDIGAALRGRKSTCLNYSH